MHPRSVDTGKAEALPAVALSVDRGEAWLCGDPSRCAAVDAETVLENCACRFSDAILRAGQGFRTGREAEGETC